MVREAGYRVGVTTLPGLVNPDHPPPETLPRSFIDRQDNLNMFEAKLTGLLDAPWGLQNAAALLGRLRRWGRAASGDRGASARPGEDPPGGR